MNQYIIQRTFAAKSLDEAQKGLAFAAFLKLLIPVIIVLPGIVAYVILNDAALQEQLVTKYGSLVNNPDLMPSLEHADKAYPWVANFLPTGFKGVVFAALAAAIVSSLASMLNSTATIFTMDIYKEYVDKNASELKLVNIGRLTAVVALVIAVFVAPMLGALDQAFQFIQEYTGMVSPGILAVFLTGLFFKKATSKGAIYGVLASIPIALALKFLPLDMPFMDQMMYTFILSMTTIVLVSLATSEQDDADGAIVLTNKTFKTSGGFAVASYIIMIITAVLYLLFWWSQIP